MPLSKAVGISQPLECAADMGFLARVFATGCDWKVSELGWMYTLFFVLLGWSLMLLWSKPWLAHFRYGPLEWLWRCLTYWKLFPITLAR